MLRAPSVGPLVGHVTDQSARLWMRAAESGDLRTVGVAALYRTDQQVVAGSARYFRLHREYDRTGTVDFEGLTQDTKYFVRMGSLVMDSTQPELLVPDAEVFRRLPPPGEWLDDLGKMPPGDALATFSTLPKGTAPFSFLFGSCRYPGVLFWRKRTDEVFAAMGGMLSDFTGAERPRFVLMLGDQIYADKLHRTIPIARAESVSEFHDRYMEAFGSVYFRKLTRSLPTYMILDDHEIEDNWSRGRLKNDRSRGLFNHAIHAYLSYQWVHGPRNFGRNLYYSFECAGTPFFALDSRTQRVQLARENHCRGNHLLGYPGKSGLKGQLEVFCDWLIEAQKRVGDAPKFVLSASVFAPNTVEDVANPHESDSWTAFPDTRRRVLRTIIENGVQNVVFLCGDVHCSIVAEIELAEATPSAKPLKAFCITSSAFYWPWPFADGDPNGFVHDSRDERDEFKVDSNTTMHYRAWNFTQDDNFTHVAVDASRKRLAVRTFDRKGQPLTMATLDLA